MLIKRIGIAKIFTLIFFIIPSLCFAFNVNIDPGAYTGQWRINSSAFFTGAQNVELPEGSHNVGVPSSSFNITIDANGFVTSTNPASATGGQNQLTFKTLNVLINPGAFTGTWWMVKGPSEVSSSLDTGPASIDLVPGLSYDFRIALLGWFSAELSDTGVFSVTNGVSATGGQNLLTFNTVNVDIDPAAYTGLWGINRGPAEARSDIRGPVNNVAFVPAVEYYFIIAQIGNFRAFLSASGIFSAVNGVSAISGQNLLTFNTVNVDIDPAAYSGNWWIRRGPLEIGSKDDDNTGPASDISLVLGVDYNFIVGHNSSFDTSLSASGVFSVANGVSAVGGQNLLTFNTESYKVTPSQLAAGESWEILGAYPADGSGDVVFLHLVPSNHYYFVLSINGASQRVNFSSTPCSVDIPQFFLGPTEFNVACEDEVIEPEFSIISSGSLNEGDPLSLSIQGGDLSAISVEWELGDEHFASGVSVEHAYEDDGIFEIKAIITTATDVVEVLKTIEIQNVSPVVSATQVGLAIVDGKLFIAGTATDPGEDTLTGTIDFGDGSASEQLVLENGVFKIAHIYTQGGVFTGAITFNDEDGGITTIPLELTVKTIGELKDDYISFLEELFAKGVISKRKLKHFIRDVNHIFRHVDRLNGHLNNHKHKKHRKHRRHHRRHHYFINAYKTFLNHKFHRQLKYLNKKIRKSSLGEPAIRLLLERKIETSLNVVKYISSKSFRALRKGYLIGIDLLKRSKIIDARLAHKLRKPILKVHAHGRKWNNAIRGITEARKRVQEASDDGIIPESIANTIITILDEMEELKTKK